MLDKHNVEDKNTTKRLTQPPITTVLDEVPCRAAGNLPCAAIDQLRPPVATVVCFAELLASTDLNDEQREYLSGLIAASHQLESRLNAIDAIIDNVQALNIDGQSGDDTEPTLTDPGACTVRRLIEQTVAAVAPTAKERAIQIVADAAGDDDQEIVVDADGLGVVLNNLVSNAVAYSNGRRVKVFAVRVKSEGGLNTYRFAVSDDGGSLDPSAVAHLFEDDSHRVTVESDDTCQGLPANQEWVARHGGHIEVAVDPGTSTTFWFDIPVALAA